MDWNKRYLQQANWTRELRAYVFAKAGLTATRRVLEVGCGTGAVIRDMPLPTSRTASPEADHSASIYGMDIDPAALAQCRTNAPRAVIACADALVLPIANQVFDIVFCHFFLLWVRNPLSALREMKRVAKNGGHIIALAEPDYTLRIDEPAELAPAGEMQTRALEVQGGDVSIGSRLAALFERAGIRLIETGQIQRHTPQAYDDQEADDEWRVLRHDLESMLSSDEIDRIHDLDLRSRHQRTRRTYVPTFFAWGQV